MSFMPPRSSKDASFEKGDKVFDHETQILSSKAHAFSLFMSSIGVLETILYIQLMCKANVDAPHGSFFSNPSVTQLRALEIWHVALTTLVILGYALRKWAFLTLDRFFTYQLTIRSEHKLIKTGPYHYVRHPSYIGLLITHIGFHVFVFYSGLWNVLVQYSAHVLSYYLRIKIAVPLTVCGIDTSIVPLVYCAHKLVLLVLYRMRNEEKMMKEHFCKEWDAFASERSRLIPRLY
ncbi:hypothetical protein BGW39_008891 [Mortierella sp. 14UC]|nr:hypothetical protein BGW39_008891 [Mortierella sp. 14UC]